MPLYALVCERGHGGEVFCHVREDFGCETRICACGGSMAKILSMGRGLTWFEEGRPRTIWNLGSEPVVIRSHEEHKRKMREAGVEWATGWQTNKTGGWV